MKFSWALVDIETTGLSITHDRMTEIAVRIINEDGLQRTWHRLINPKIPIPAAITALRVKLQEWGKSELQPLKQPII